MLEVMLFGDSIGRGIVFDEGRGRYGTTPKAYYKTLEAQGALKIHNHSRFGATVKDGLADFEALTEMEAKAVAIEFGGNDCSLNWPEVAANPEGDARPLCEINEFERTLDRFVALARARGLRPLLVTPAPLVSQSYYEWVSQGLDQEAILRFIGDVNHVYRWQERYAAAVYRAAYRLSCPLFDLRSLLISHRHMPSLYCRDGMHLNEEGQSYIANCIMDSLGSLKKRLLIKLGSAEKRKFFC